MTVNVYVLDAFPSAEITVTVIVFNPTTRLIAGEAAPVTTGALFTVMVLADDGAVAVTVTAETVFATESEYANVPEANVGLILPDDTASATNVDVELDDPADASMFVPVSHAANQSALVTLSAEIATSRPSP